MSNQNTIYFSIPGFYLHFNLLTELIRLYKNESYKFKDNIVISSVYDCFPCIWNGGRFFSGGTSLKNIQETFKAFDNNIGLRLTFTNALLEQEHCYDTVGNAILKEAAKQKIPVGITINSPILKQYIEQQYPNTFYFNWSATKSLDDICEINELTKNDFLVPNYQKVNNNFDLLTQLINKENIELIVDEGCNDDCPRRKTHYLSFNKAQLFQATDVELCTWDNGSHFYGRKTGRKHNITPQDIQDKYLPLGFNHFKIAGREDNYINLIESFVYYLIKDEWKDIVRNDLLNFCYYN